MAVMAVTPAGLRRYGPDLGLTGACLIAAVSMSRLLGGGLGGPATGPLFATAGIGAVLPAVLGLRRVRIPIRMVAGTVAVVLVALWTTSPGSTSAGLPTARTWRALEAHLRAAHPILVAFRPPLRATEGIVLLAALLAGTVSVLASVVLHAVDRPGRLYPGLALLLPLVLLALVCLHSPRPSVALPVALFVAAAAVTLSTARPAALKGPAPIPLARRVGPTAALTATVMVAVTLVALSFGPGGLTGAGAGPTGTGAVPPTDLSLMSSLVALEVHDANTVMFRAHSPYPTYWQVAVLNTLREGVWVADATPAPASPGEEVPTTADEPTFAATVQIGALSTRLLPVPPATTAVAGPHEAKLTATGILADQRTQRGQHYTTTSATPVNDPGALAAVGTYPPALLRAEVALPTLPASIKAMARKATAGASTPMAQAEALVNWFRSGKFRYTLDPPTPPAGVDPLVSFLTQSRSGTCEQFAGAFTVLARSLGLPTRLVVGFTAGRRTGADEVTVRGADAHAWPQVYLGSAAGWVSFEPTPQQPTGEVVPDGVVGTTAPSVTVPPTTTVTPTTAPTTTPTVPPTTTPAPAPGTGHRPPHQVTKPAGWWRWWFLGVLVGLLAAVSSIVGLLRRHARRLAENRDPSDVVMTAEARVDRALKHAGVARPAWQPLSLFIAARTRQLAHEDSAVRASRPDLSDQLIALLDDAATVAQVADHARYDRIPIAERQALAAAHAASRVTRGLKRREIRRLLSDGRDDERRTTTPPLAEDAGVYR